MSPVSEVDLLKRFMVAPMLHCFLFPLDHHGVVLQWQLKCLVFCIPNIATTDKLHPTTKSKIATINFNLVYENSLSIFFYKILKRQFKSLRTNLYKFLEEKFPQKLSSQRYVVVRWTRLELGARFGLPEPRTGEHEQWLISILARHIRKWFINCFQRKSIFYPRSIAISNGQSQSQSQQFIPVDPAGNVPIIQIPIF